ncbi:MAG: hypothetical protein M3Y07_08525 [Acidobacteriota bacterium]|nr:hypothetical protein [Acidobacteriota bacterium]
MPKNLRFWIAGVIVSGCVLLLGWQRQASTPSSPLVDNSAISIRVRFGMAERQPRAWDGSLSATGGEILNLRDWHPRPGDKITGKTAWSLATRQGPIFQRRPTDDELLVPTAPYLLIPGIIIDAQPTATIHFQTAQGSFDVRAANLIASKAEHYLSANATVDLVPSAQMLSETSYQNDFATLSAGKNGELWAGWVGYRNQGDDILVRRFDGTRWAPAIKVNEKPLDVFLVKLGRDRNGSLWAIWSAQENGNFDLYARRYDGKSWSPAERLTDDPQPDIYHNVATDSNGNLWVVWQAFRNGKSDILARRFDGQAWSAAEKVSDSPANDWEPAIAADRNGRVYVAWDTYDKGNYDVRMRSWANGKWSEPVAIAATPKFEAHVSLACDKDDRLWAAWNESGFEWGKDTGFLVKREGTRLYQWRSIGMAVLENGTWRTPGDVNAALPRDLRGYNDFPVLQAAADGRIWLFFRHRFLRIADTPSDTPAHRAAWELYATTWDGGWAPPIQAPFSQGRQDVRAGFAADDRGNLWAAWPMDNRDFEAFLFQRSDVYAARIPQPPRSNGSQTLAARQTPSLMAFPHHGQEEQDLARIRGYTIESGGKTYHIYRGDTHRHTEFSMDGNNDGALEQTYRYAIDAAQLDYLAETDHNGDGGPDVDYISWILQQMCDVMMLPKKFIPIYAYERSLNYPNGHRNILFAKRGIPTLPASNAEKQGTEGAAKLYAYLKKYSGIAIPHTSATNMGTDWRDNDPAVEPLVEIYQGDRVSAEYEGAPKAAYAGNATSAPGGFRPAGYVWNAWAKGYKLGVQVSSDHLSTHISFACTIAPDGTRESLLDAMRQRHSYGATDNIVLDYRLKTSDGKEHLQGDIIKASGDYQLMVKVIGTKPIRQIDVIRNNRFVHTREPMQREVNFTFTDNEKPSGARYYYVRVIQVDDQMAWSSPIWIQ